MEDKEVFEAIQEFYSAEEKLRKIGIKRSNRIFHSDLGEWYAQNIFQYNLHDNKVNRTGDLVSDDGKRIEIKTSHRAEDNKAKRIEIKKSQLERIDELIIFILYQNYQIKDVYKIPQIEIYKKGVEKKNHYHIYPERLTRYKLRIHDYTTEFTKIYWPDFLDLFNED